MKKKTDYCVPLMRAGIEFVDKNGGGVGVRLKEERSTERRPKRNSPKSDSE